MQKITPFLWYDKEAEEAANLYTSLFSNSRIVDVTRFEDDGPVMTVTFQLDGQDFIALNGGPQFKFTEAMSLFVNCESQEEVDRLWDKLSQGGEKQQCGWLKDKYGVSWQIIPSVLVEMLRDEDPEKSKRVMTAMLQMQKIDTKALREAYELS